MACNMFSFAQGWLRPTISTMGFIDLVLLIMYVCYIPNCLGLLQTFFLLHIWDYLTWPMTIQPLGKHAMTTSQPFTSPQRYGYSQYWKRFGSWLGQTRPSSAPQGVYFMLNGKLPFLFYWTLPYTLQTLTNRCRPSLVHKNVSEIPVMTRVH